MARPRWMVLAGTVVGVAAAVALGTWQLNRAAQKIALERALDDRGHLPALSTNQLPSADEPPAEALLHRRATLQGQWDTNPAHTVYLDNRPMDGRVGFFVLTPFRLTGRSDALLVQRGWVPRDAEVRERLPAIITPEGDVRIEGRLAGAPSRAFELGAPVGAGPIRQNVDLSAFQGETGVRLLPLVLLQTESVAATASPAAPLTPSLSTPSPDGLLRHWPPPAVDVHKHYGYAFQWFALGALILGLYVWFQVLAPLRRDRRRRDTRDADAT